ncbi:MAG: 4-alpha-glucanotransferase [Weeksellaceae bacterium]|nr:4-alpha-glucanotransferase [Weeksellaceae bacterium]
MIFYVEFHSVEGQNLYVTGDVAALGEWDAEKAVPMKYVGKNMWQANVEIDEKTFHYQYFLHDARTDARTFEWKQRDCTVESERQLLLFDKWYYPDLPELNLQTKFFDVMSQTPDTQPQQLPEDATHRFIIDFPLMQPHHRMCLFGNMDELGNWDESKPILMEHVGSGRWYADVKIGPAIHNLEYKYGVYDTQTSEVLYFEEGDNRAAPLAADRSLWRISDTRFRSPAHTKWRGSGVAVPVFSLRSKESLGVGEFADLRIFGDWCREAGFSMIQILPIHDTTAKKDWTDSYPYAAISVYALHPMYLRLQELPFALTATEKKKIETQKAVLNGLASVDYEAVNHFKHTFLRSYFAKHAEKIFKRKAFKDFLKENADWVKPYAVFSVLRDLNDTADFTQWQENSKLSKEQLEEYFDAKHEHYNLVHYYVFVQWQLHEQLSAAVEYLHGMRITLKGDLPIGIYRHSVDAWGQPELFHMDQQAGAPPDDFAVLGQNWEFPTYNWPRMQEDDFAWWKSRFTFMSRYFDAFRIDHILGFFRIWQIPMHATQGILGRFEPAMPYHIDELRYQGLQIGYERLTKPFLHYKLLQQYFGEETQDVIQKYFTPSDVESEYKFQDHYASQRQVVDELGKEHEHTERLLELHANVLFLVHEGEPAYLHPRFALYNTNSFKWLNAQEQHFLRNMHNDYFFKRQEQFWKQKGLEKLPALKQATRMLTCGEDLGLVPKVVPQVMKDLAILGLQVQRMPAENLRFSNPKDAPYLSVVSPSSHDTSTLRQWWQEDRNDTQYYFRNILGHYGSAPHMLTVELLWQIVEQHLYSPAMLSVIPIQEFLAMNHFTSNADWQAERINVPANFPHYWRYRMHLNIEDLIDYKEYTESLLHLHRRSGRIG